ncbi:MULTISPECIES: CheR family methyltransferase [unclassified Sedimentibacter]|uniref:CheR family methyltransferase n=1 Tax=unclassified Sedimentibacter TaxID=2649220 RepID=UPI0027DEBDF7|nr:protein-glutamate O-methyltransferase CheR [Sedimentibacter sp. MB35-C1]WMJ78629.1 protein-glutamate O-methyltransferase CheR [Sedimentibacter sp. MB35-C1]
MVKLTDGEFLEFVHYMHNNYGIDLSKKRILIEGRLSNIIEKKGMKSFGQYLENVKKNNKDEITTLINKLTTNYTYFYREDNHFKYLKDVILPYEEKNNKSKILSIWSAGCSSGEEPYTLAMVIDDYFKFSRGQWKIQILATDISENVLSKAREGVYAEDSLKNLPEAYKKRYFAKTDDGKFRVLPNIRKYITFNVFNLMNPIAVKNKHDVIFCRNVMIYFNAETKINMVNKFYEATKPGGYLMIGHAETIQRNQSKYQYINPAIYKKV